MSQTWQTFDEAEGGTSVYDALSYQRTRTNTLASMFSGTSAPSTPTPADGTPWFDTSTGDKQFKLYVDSGWREVCVLGYTQLTTTELGDDIVTQAKIADAAVGEDQLITGAVSAGKLATDAVETAKIKDVNVTAAKLATDSVETAKIAASAVTAAKLATDAVETDKVKDLNVTTAKLAASAVTTAKVADGAITSAKLAGGAGNLTVTSKSTTYTAAASDFVVATVSTSWTLTLPSGPSANDRVAVYLDSISSEQELTISASHDIASYGTSVKMFIAGDRLELVFTGSKWVIVSEWLSPHLAQMSVDSFERTSSYNSWTSVPFDTVDFDRASLASTGTGRITIRRDGEYAVRAMLFAGQSGPTGWMIRVLKNGSVIRHLLHDDVTDYVPVNADTDLDGRSHIEVFQLSASDYLQLEMYGYIDSPNTGLSQFAVEERL